MKTLLVLALAAAPLLAQPAPSADDAERLTAARKLVHAMELAKTMEASMAASQEAVGTNLVESLMRTNPAFEKLEGEQRTKMLAALTAMTKRLQDKMQAELKKEINVGEEVASILAPVYAGYFTTAEIRKLIEFYESPLGKKLALASAATQPEISKRMQADLLPRMMTVMERVVRDQQMDMATEMSKIVDDLMKNKP